MIDSLVKVSFIGVEMLIGLICFNRADGLGVVDHFIQVNELSGSVVQLIRCF